jgi:plasmid stability protein
MYDPNFNFRAPASLIEELKVLADEHERSLSAEARFALRQHVRRSHRDGRRNDQRPAERGASERVPPTARTEDRAGS